VQDARYYRAQAQIYLNLAQRLTDAKSAEALRLSAADALSKAIALENAGPTEPPGQPIMHS